MAYQKFLVIASRKDIAGMNIITQLFQFRKSPIWSGLKDEKIFDIYIVEDEIVYNKNLNLSKINEYDFIIFASKHVSSKGEKAFAVHSVGNWKGAEFGGENGRAGKTSALFQKFLFEKLGGNINEYKIKNYALTMEATHHGPLIEKPCIFVEIGSTEIEYNDRRAAFIVAKTISESIGTFKENPYHEIAIAIGGPHYCPNFNKIQLKSNIAISHMIPNYSMPITEKILKEAIEKTDEQVDFVVVDWKGLGKAEQRDEIIKILEKNYVQWKKTSDIKKDRI